MSCRTIYGARASRRVLAVLAVASTGVLANPAVAIELQDIPFPDGVRLEIIGDDIVQNGQRLSIASFESGSPVDNVLAWYRDRWLERAGAPGHIEVELGGWHVISRLQEGSNVVLQLQATPDGGASGLLSVLDLDAPAAADRHALPMPAGGSLLSDTVTRDGTRRARTLMLEVVGRPGAVAAFYRDRLRRDGWQVAVDDGDASPAVLLLSGPDGRAELTVSTTPDGLCFVVLNVITGAR